MSKLIRTDNLERLAKALDERYKEINDIEVARATAVEANLDIRINEVEDMLGGKSIVYITQAEYDNLTEDEKNVESLTYFITDAEDLSHEHENKEFLDNLAARNITIGDSTKVFDGASNLSYSINEIGAAPVNHNHDDKYYTETEIDSKIEDINENINNVIATHESHIQTLDNIKLNTDLAVQTFISSDANVSVNDGTVEHHVLQKNGVQIVPYVLTDTVLDNNGKTLTNIIGNEELLTDTKDSLIACINELQSEINELDIYKANKEDLAVVDAITLNGYSLWVGTTTELESIGEKDPNTLYFEIDDGTGEEVVQVDVVDGILTLTDDKYQKTTMVNGTEIVFPEVNKFTEIHLYFDTEEDMNITFPECKWRVEPNIEEGKSYEIVATYNTIQWLVNVIVYS